MEFKVTIVYKIFIYMTSTLYYKKYKIYYFINIVA